MKRWEEASAGSADYYLSPTTVLEQAETALVVTDRFGNILYMNPHAARAFGGWSKRHVGQSILSLTVPEKDHALIRDLTRHVLKGGVWEGTFDVVRVDGAMIYVRVHAVPLRHPSGAITGVVMFGRQALRSNEADQDQFGLLERISERLASSLYLDETLKRLGDMLVPQFADHFFLDLLEGDRLVRRVARHTGGWKPPPGTWADVGETVHYAPGHFCEKAMRRLETILVGDIEHHRFPAPSVASVEVTEAIGLTSVIASPLYTRGELLGVMSLARSRLSPRDMPTYDGYDRDLIGAIATRVAVAIDNAMLFEEERKTAESFQRQLLPKELPTLDGLEIAARYFPAAPLVTQGHGIQTQVGGDWYDVIPLSAGRVGIVIGDVEGRGAKAAAIMGQLRAALRAFAQDDKSPADILSKLDEWVRVIGKSERDFYGAEHREIPLVSCMYLVYDAWSRQLSFATAGHAPPLMIADGEAGELDVEEKNVMLGVRGKGINADVLFQEETRELPPGATLILYTDGLVDRRPREDGWTMPNEEAVKLLREAVARVAHESVERIADEAIHAVPGEIDDDMAVLVLRSSPTDLAVVERTFPAHAVMVSEARQITADTLAGWGASGEQIELACLLVSEVVTNVVLHASAQSRRHELVLDGPPQLYDEYWGQIALEDQGCGSWEYKLRLRRGASSLWVEVFDQDLRLPRIRSAGANDEGGRGLYLVDQLASRWGSRPTRDGKAVWFEIPMTNPSGP